MLVVRLAGIGDAAAAFGAAIDDELALAAARGAEIVAASARAEHTYTTRTGDLEAATQAGSVEGVFTAETLTFVVSADIRYASWVDEGTVKADAYPFLLPAFARCEGQLYDAIGEGFSASARRAGWRAS